jgi:hypothetical protein
VLGRGSCAEDEGRELPPITLIYAEWLTIRTSRPRPTGASRRSSNAVANGRDWRLGRNGTCYEPGGGRRISEVERQPEVLRWRFRRTSAARVMVPWKWVIQLECRLAGQVLHRREVATIAREATPLLPEHVGLTLRDGTTVLHALQRAVVTDQVEAEAAAWWT